MQSMSKSTKGILVTVSTVCAAVAAVILSARFNGEDGNLPVSVVMLACIGVAAFICVKVRRAIAPTLIAAAAAFLLALHGLI